jgi:hypothetical protein
MQTCSSCGADLPENSRFCGRCGSVQDAPVIDAAATSITPSLPVQPTPWSPLSDVALGGEVLLGSGQPASPGVPAVPGTPQISSAPSIAGPPSASTNIPVGHPALGGGNAAPASPGVQGPAGGAHAQGAGNVPATHPTQGPVNTPISQPTHGSTHTPVNHPAQGPTKMPHPRPEPHPIHHPPQQPEPHPIHQPPEQPGTHHHDPIREHHRDHEHHEHPRHHSHQEPEGKQEHQSTHEHHQRHDHAAEHELHRLAHTTKVAGGSTVKTIVLVVVAAAVVAAGGIAAAAHFLSHAQPQPLISVASSYRVGTTPAGAQGTILHISGQQFASNAAITLLLDGHVAPGNPGARSDANGNFSTAVTITSAWSVGTHTLSARDASNDSPKDSISVAVVQQGQANTPGPNGAPPDDASFRIKVTIGYQVADPFSQNPVLIITGHPDPEGGTICSPYDSGQSFTFNESAFEGTLLIKTLTATCSGTYKAGQINFVETTTSVTQHWQGNETCVRNTPTVDLRLTGAYAGNNTFKGTLSSPYFTYTCDQGYSNTYHEASTGVSWTGTVITTQ